MLLALLLLAAPVDREVLMQLLTVDTSHGHETQALQPVLERFKAAGIPAQLIESGEGRGSAELEDRTGKFAQCDIERVIMRGVPLVIGGFSHLFPVGLEASFG